MKTCKKILIVLFMGMILSMVNGKAVYANPYPLDGGHGVAAGNCTWRAWQEAYDRLGISLPTWGNAKDWYQNAKAAGYTVVPWVPGQYVPSDSIAVWDGSTGGGYGHVAYVVSTDENGWVLCEGNFSPTTNNPVYYSRWEQRWSWGARSSGLIGFIQLKGASSTSSWTVEVKDIIETNATLTARYTTGGTKYFGYKGVNIYDEWGNLIGQAGYDPGYTGSYIDISFNINNDTNQKLKLQPGKIYKYQFYVNTGANDQFSSMYTFKTKAPTHTHSYSSSVTKSPTCTATGVRTYTCSCGASYTEAIPAKGHNYKNQVIAPTLTEKGYTLHTCSACGNSYKDAYVNPPELNSDGWYYSNTLPSGITTDKYTIEYNNYYEKIQANSPGSGWTNAATVKNEWQNSGSPYTSETDLPTSDSRVLVRSVYYHFCGPNAGAAGNYDLSGNFVHYDEIGAPSVIPTYCGTDNGHPYYVLDWIDGGGRVWCQSGVTCDGSYGTHGERCKAWYKMNTYQDRVKVVQYKFTKNSGWVKTKDASATSVKVRFKSIESETPKPETSESGTDTEKPETEISTPETTDAYHFNVRLSGGKFYFTWNMTDTNAVYTVEYSIIPTTGFLAETMYEVISAESGKMCYTAPASPYNYNTPLYFRIKQEKENMNPVYSEVLEFNWPTYKVTFMDGNKVISEQDVYEGDSASAPSPVKTGYKLSWNGNYTNVTSDVTVYAVWTKTGTDEDAKDDTDNRNHDNDSITEDASDDDTDVIESVSLKGISNKIAAGKKIKLSAVVVPADAANQALVWKSSNPKYATVSSNGLVTTKKKGAGKTVTISAATKDGSDIVATYKIKIVKHAVKSVKITAKSKTVKAGKKLSLKAHVKTTGKTANKTLTWTSSNEKYATVSKKGVVKTTKQGKGKTVKITAKATDGTGKKAVVKIKIE